MIQPHNITKEELIREIEALRAERDQLVKERDLFLRETTRLRTKVLELYEKVDSLTDPEERPLDTIP